MHSRGDEDLHTLGCLLFFLKKLFGNIEASGEKRLLSALLKNLQYQSYLSSDGTRDFLHNCSGRGHSIMLWMYICNLKYFFFFFLITKEKHKKKIQTWSPCRDIEAFKHGACLRPLLKLYQLEHWIIQTQGIWDLCHSVLESCGHNLTWNGVAALSGSRHTALWFYFGFWWMICSRVALSFLRDTLKGLQLQYVVESNFNSKVPESVLFRRLKILFKNIFKTEENRIFNGIQCIIMYIVLDD